MGSAFGSPSLGMLRLLSLLDLIATLKADDLHFRSPSHNIIGPF